MEKTADVWVWLHGESTPTHAGNFSWRSDTQVGYFTYAETYLANQSRFLLDPATLPFRRSRISETRQHGIFGVFRDSGPDAWGRDKLIRSHGDLDEFDILVRGPGDGVGSIVIGNIEEKLRFHPPRLADLDEASRHLDDAGKAVDPEIELALDPTTSMGGAKPKLTVSDVGLLWIAKFPEKGDSRFIAHNEHVMLEMARECGVASCESRIHPLHDGRHILLIKRFDRGPIAAGTRKAFASAHTVLQMGEPATDGIRKSYLRLVENMQKWCGDQSRSNARELWRRIVFNALVGNGDDHAKNHGLLFDGRAWALSEAFDIVAAPKRNHVALALRFSASTTIATPQSLFECASAYAYEPDEAELHLRKIAGIISGQWSSRLEKAGVDGQEIDRLRSAFKLAEASKDAQLSRPAIQQKTKRFRKG
ncbi:MAG: type II toxin-antitoxin system HipA family toxin [Sulfuritalea sp.]|nr:type II toxin-antitoxin system HipA family toxin [Sulfuritalea sp.]